MHRMSFFLLRVAMGLLASLSLGFALKPADPWQMNMPKGVTPVGHDIYDLHMIAIYICAVIGLIVFGVMTYSIIHHRKSKGHQAAQFHENTRLEIVWTIIPFLILVGLAIPATRVLVQMDNTADSDVTIKVIGSQWKWEYQYLNEGIRFYSNLATPFDQIENKAPKGQWYLLEVDKPLVVPVNKKIRFLVTSQDVVHSWWVPDLGIKRDAIPGFMYESWAWIEKPGTYRGQCAELCGINHGFMPIVVKALKQDEYEKWVQSQARVEDRYRQSQTEPEAQKPMTREALMSLGKQRYQEVCSACHKLDGSGLPPLYPALKNSSIAVGKPISRHIAMILNGVPGSAMQAYKDMLSDKDIAAIVTFERNAWGNNTNDVIQAAEVAKVRNANQVEPKVVNKVNAGRLQ